MADPVARDEMVELARRARTWAHAPYSGYAVGACAEDSGGGLHVGCNVENAAYPEGLCAEAVALGALVAAGGGRLRSIVVVGGPAGEAERPSPPCGGCRQKLAELALADARVYVLDRTGAYGGRLLGELLPDTFRLKP